MIRTAATQIFKILTSCAFLLATGTGSVPGVCREAADAPRVSLNFESEDVISAVDTTETALGDIKPCFRPGRQWHLATNAVEWGMAIANLTGEYDFSPRWSVALSLHYSAWNYGKVTRKFRTFIFRPEARIWLNDCIRGLFFNAHLQMAAYNFALPSWEYRIQDTGGKHPALGGGVGIGYRLNLDRKGRWSAQADLSVGVYHLDYNRFRNVRNGELVDRKSHAWAGIDHFGISIVYNFKSRRR